MLPYPSHGAGENEVVRLEQRARRLEDRVIALTARLSAAEDRSSANQEQLAQAEAKQLKLRRRLELAQAELERYAAAAVDARSQRSPPFNLALPLATASRENVRRPHPRTSPALLDRATVRKADTSSAKSGCGERSLSLRKPGKSRAPNSKLVLRTQMKLRATAPRHNPGDFS